MIYCSKVAGPRYNFEYFHSDFPGEPGRAADIS